MIQIATLNYYIEGENILNTKIDGNETLLDADLVIIQPDSFKSLWRDIVAFNYDNHPVIKYPESESIYRILKSRAAEIDALLEYGKVIICILCPISGFLGGTKDRYVEKTITNYSIFNDEERFLTEYLKEGKGVGSAIKQKNKNLLSNFYGAFKDSFEYKVYLDYKRDEPNINFLTNKADKPVGFFTTRSKGIIGFLPDLNSSIDKNKLLSVLIDSANIHFKENTPTPEPVWLNNFKLAGEDEYSEKIQKFDSDIAEISRERNEEINKRQQLIKYKGLLYENGKLLENIVIDAFRLMGFEADGRRIDDMEHDVIFESKEGKGLAEIEGKDSDAIHITKLDQLNRALDEDFELTNIYPQGVLIGNHYRLIHPEERNEPFTNKVIVVAKKKNIGLLTTCEIYKAIERILADPENEQIKSLFREKILSTEGEIISFD